jgi:hypothetical protein
MASSSCVQSLDIVSGFYFDERERTHCVCGWLGASNSHFLSLAYGRSNIPVDILSIIYCKNNLRIDYKKHLTSFHALYGYYLEFSSAMS